MRFQIARMLCDKIIKRQNLNARGSRWAIVILEQLSRFSLTNASGQVAIAKAELQIS